MIRFFVRHPVSTWMIFAVFILLGTYALPRLQVEAIPEVNLPTLTIQTFWNGASPQAIQRSITIPVEEAAQKVHGVEKVTSTSSPGRSQVEIEFRRDVNIDFARVDLNEELGSVRRNLPLNAGQPQILPYVPEEFQTEDFFTFSLESSLHPNELRELAETWVVPQILALEGVADARVLGGARPLIKVFLDRQLLERYEITPDQVANALNRLDALDGAGIIQQRGMEKFVALRDPVDYKRLASAVVARRGGRTFTLDMLGEVRRDFEDPVYFVRTNGRNVVQVSVDKRSGSNTVGVSRVLRDALPRVESQVPFDVSFNIDEDQGEELEQKLRELVYRSLAILVLLFILLTLSLVGVRRAALIAASTVVAVAISLGLFYLLRTSLNFFTIAVSLASLALLAIPLALFLRQTRLGAIVAGSITFAVVTSLSLLYFLHIPESFITICALLTVLVLLPILIALSQRQIRLTAIITGSIVFAVVISLSLFYFLRISVNFITISGLTVCFGLILDNSILVLDSIHRRLKAMDKADEAGLSRKAKLKVALEMILSGTQEVLFPILATTLTTIVAFVSFIFLSGRLALFYVPLGVSVGTALAASLFVAFGWVPMVLHGSWARPLVYRSTDGPNDVSDPAELAGFSDELPDLDARPPLLERIFARNQRLWWIVVPLLIGLFVWSGFIYKDKVQKGGFWRLPSQEELILFMRLPPGTDIRLTSETLAGFEAVLMPIPDGVTARSTVWSNQAFMRIEFEEKLLSTEIPIYFRTALTDHADKLGGSAIFIYGFSETPYINGNFMGSALNSLIKITGFNSQKLSEISETALAQIERNRRVRNPRITTGGRFGRATQEEVVMTVHRDRLATHGITVLEVVRHLRQLLGVDTPWSMLVEGENERVQLSFYDSETLEYSDAVQTLIKTSEGRNVRIADLVSIETVPLSGSITREDQRYTSYLNWEYIGTDQMRQAYMKSVLASLNLPYGYDAEESRRETVTEEEEGELAMAIALAVIFIFMVLAAVFESVSLPFLVLVSVPMALVGVFFAFWWTNSAFDSSAKIGLILLFGIVVNNAILLLSRFRTESTLILKAKLGGDPGGEAALFPGLKKDLGGSDLWDLPAKERGGLLHRAIARATRIRLRSILLTSGTTIVGLTPLLVRFRETQDKDIWENLALASIGGLASSTILLLFALPALYYVCVRFDWAILRHVRINKLMPMRGRFDRQEYFATNFMIALLTVLLVAAVGAAIIFKGPGKDTAFLVAKILAPLGLIVMAFACVKRLHDLNKSGWHFWLLLVPLYNIYLLARMLFARSTEDTVPYGGSPADNPS